MMPMDSYNQELLAQVRPPDWVNPPPRNPYDLVVLGAGTAGLVIAAGAAGLGIGLKVALVEKRWLGGDCLNWGCVPSKAMIRAARAAQQVKTAHRFGIAGTETATIDFEQVMARMRQLRAAISPHDSAERFRSLGVDVFFGEGRFIDRQTLAVGETHLSFQKAAIATGAKATHPPIPGLGETGFLTHETVFSLTTCPERLAVIGGGPVGCELAQTFQRLGAQVTLLHRGPQLLSSLVAPETEAGAILAQSLRADGVQVVLNASVEKVERRGAEKILYYRSDRPSATIAVTEILVSVGRIPQREGLNLEAAGVRHDRRGIQVNDYLQTHNPRIYAAGDSCLAQKFTHSADAAARIVVKNALFSPMGLGRSKVSDLVIPAVVYTDPEVAQVGLSPAVAAAQSIPHRRITVPLEQGDRAILDGASPGFLQILYGSRGDAILGAIVVAPQAGELITVLTTAIQHRLGLGQLAQVIHPYPTQGEIIKKAADAYRRSLLTPTTQRLLAILNALS